MKRIAGSLGPPDIVVRICCRGTIPAMVAKLRRSHTLDQTVFQAADGLAG
jgi:hypothetical protein